MSLHLASHRLEEVFCNELATRLPSRVIRMGQRDTADSGPLAVVKCDHIDEITPDIGVYEAELAIVVVWPMDSDPPEGTTQAAELSRFVGEVEKSLNQIPRPGVDDDVGIELLGWTVTQIAEAISKQDRGYILYLKVGCKLPEKRMEPEVQAEV